MRSTQHSPSMDSFVDCLQWLSQFCPLSLNSLNYLSQFNPHALRFYHELLHFLLQESLSVSRACFRWLGDHGADAGTYFEPSLLDQVLNHFVHRVGMDLQLRCQGSHGASSHPDPRTVTVVTVAARRLSLLPAAPVAALAIPIALVIV